ncbi:uncharacterized protein UTRI_06611 [Ustilago trichophora]|uniref:C3H1-type domain-containing protein n=1 Tax=Ustilago trichophora TaxID=86804 RepID=A0A5C3EPU1_9BASI|nr:uncharacterized protein UTRI_06611 [Ustilago trichophora]
MDSSSGYGSWPMQPNSNPELAWHLGPNNVPQPNGAAPMQSLYASSPASLNASMVASLYPAFPGGDPQLGQHQHHHHQQQQYFQQPPQPLYPPQPQYLPQQYAEASPLNSIPSSSGVPPSNVFSPDTISVNATTFNELKAMYPHASPDQLINAIFHAPQSGPNGAPTQPQAHQQAQPQQQQSTQLPPQLLPQHQPSVTYTQQNVYGSQSGHSLANALAFTSPPAVPANLIPGPTYGVPQPVASAVTASAGLPSTATALLTQASSSSASSSTADGKKKTNKLRQSKLTFLPGIAHAVSKEATQSPPSAQAAAAPGASSGVAGATPAHDIVSEPGTPPLPLAKALATKASTGGSTASSCDTKSAASTAPTADSVLWAKAKQALSRLSVERTPEQSARQLVQTLCELDSAGRFRQVVSTGAEVRKTIIKILHAIATLEKGRGFTDNGRKKFFGTWMAIPGGRHILSTWLRQTVPPKKLSDGVSDLSRRYKQTLLPLLDILGYVPIKRAYLTDEAGLGKAITGVSNRAEASAAKLAQSLKAKWTKVIENEGSSTAPPARPAAAAASTATSASSTAATKRKPTESATAAESSSKRYKTGSATASASANVKTTKPATASTTTSTTAKPGLSFFGPGSVKKPASTIGTSSTSAGGATRMNAHQSVMSLMDKISGGSASDRSTAAQAGKDASSSAQNQEKPKKRVRWREESELVAIKLIEPADYGQGDGDDDVEIDAPIGGVDEHDEGLALRQSVSTMEALMDWREPREVIVTMADSGPVGSESVEGPFQAQREAQLEEVVYEEGKEPQCPDESQLEQPGTISETPEELKGQESIEIPTPWMEEYSAGMDAMEGSAGEMGEGIAKMEGEPQSAAAAAPAASTGAPSTADLSALLSKVGQVVANGSNTTPASTSTSVQSASTSAPSAPLSFDVNQLQSILASANGNGPNSNAVNAAMASSNVSSGNLSALLSNLTSGLNANRASVPLNGSEANEGGYWQCTYRDNGASIVPKTESYPGEYQQEYTRGGQSTQRYGQQSESGYRYGSSSGWDDGSQNYGGNQNGGWGNGDSNYGGGSGGGGGGGGAWQSKIHTKTCKFFAQGNCFRGDSCHFRHG